MTLLDMVDLKNVRQIDAADYEMRVWADKRAIEVIDQLKQELAAERAALAKLTEDYDRLSQQYDDLQDQIDEDRP